MYFSGRAGKTGCSITLIERRDRKQAEVKIKPLLYKTVLALIKNVLIYNISMNYLSDRYFYKHSEIQYRHRCVRENLFNIFYILLTLNGLLVNLNWSCIGSFLFLLSISFSFSNRTWSRSLRKRDNKFRTNWSRWPTSTTGGRRGRKKEDILRATEEEAEGVGFDRCNSLTSFFKQPKIFLPKMKFAIKIIEVWKNVFNRRRLLQVWGARPYLARLSELGGRKRPRRRRRRSRLLQLPRSGSHLAKLSSKKFKKIKID